MKKGLLNGLLAVCLMAVFLVFPLSRAAAFVDYPGSYEERDDSENYKGERNPRQIEAKNVISELGVITGEEITNDEVLGTIFGKFCIGK